MTLPKSLTTVTTFSKLLALWLYLFLPFAGFYLGISYGKLDAKEIQPIIRINKTSKDEQMIKTTTPDGWIQTTYEDLLISYPATWELTNQKLDTYDRLNLSYPDDISTYSVFIEKFINHTSKTTSSFASLSDVIKNSNEFNLPKTQWKNATINNIKVLESPIIHVPSLAASDEQYVLLMSGDNKYIYKIFFISHSGTNGISEIFSNLIKRIKINSPPHTSTTYSSPTPVIDGTSGNYNNTVCIQDARMCPNGSYVSRTGPNCEFAPCEKMEP